MGGYTGYGGEEGDVDILESILMFSKPSRHLKKREREGKVNDVVLLFLKRKSDVNPYSESIIKCEREKGSLGRVASEPYRYSRHNGIGIVTGFRTIEMG